METSTSCKSTCSQRGLWSYGMITRMANGRGIHGGFQEGMGEVEKGQGRIYEWKRGNMLNAL